MNSTEENYDNVTFNDEDPYVVGSFVCSCLMLIVALIGITGNVLTVYVFTRRFMKNSINLLLTGLAVVDIVLIITGFTIFSPRAVFTYYSTQPSSLAWLYIILTIYPIALMSRTASVWIMVLITLERYVAVCWPLQARYLCNKHRTNIALVCVIMFSVCYNLVRYWELTLDEEEIELKFLLKQNSLYLHIYIHWLYFIIIFFLPVMVLIIFQNVIIRTIRKARQNRCELSRQESKEHNTALMMTVITLIFLICNFLSITMNGVEAFSSDDFLTYYSNQIYLFSDMNNLLVEINSSVTFVIYYCFSRKFRLTFNGIFHSTYNHIDSIRFISSR